jgi:hypothetical protein
MDFHKFTITRFICFFYFKMNSIWSHACFDVLKAYVLTYYVCGLLDTFSVIKV